MPNRPQTGGFLYAPTNRLLPCVSFAHVYCGAGLDPSQLNQERAGLVCAPQEPRRGVSPHVA
jgi:hypothetical protein